MVVSIDMLPGEVLVEIFDFYVVEAMEEEDVYSENEMEAWRALVHVCRRWRSVVFGSPRRLKLKVYCTTQTPLRDRLDVWPALPLVIEGHTVNVDNIIPLLECSDRINQIILWGSNYWEDIWEVMKVSLISFPELTYLSLEPNDKAEPVLPLSDSFLSGSVPRLQYLNLDNIPFPGLPKLLSSTTNLTILHLLNIPHSGYISPGAMVACLSLLTSLDRLVFGFRSSQSRPDRESRCPPPSSRTVLPVLTYLGFRGVCEYLEDLVARVDAPRLDFFQTTFFNDIVFDTPQIAQFISRTPTLKAFEKATFYFGDYDACIRLFSKASSNGRLDMTISCRELDWQVSFLEQLCTSFCFFLHLPALEDLYIVWVWSQRNWGGDIDN